ncbi:reverse transcriptase [Tanacetum coccineum]
MSTIHRNQRNRISRLKNEQGHWVDSPTQLHKFILDHFSKIYSTFGDRNFNDVLDMLTHAVTNSMSLQLEAPVLQVEIDKVVKDLGAHKAPGEDGFPGIFFQKYWHIVGDSVPSPKTIGQFRPISLCNFVYRVISKVMANRLKPFMHCLISPQQSAFIPGRLIQDCMIVANEAFHYIRNKKKGEQKVMALKLDLNKAFDRVG